MVAILSVALLVFGGYYGFRTARVWWLQTRVEQEVRKYEVTIQSNAYPIMEYVDGCLRGNQIVPIVQALKKLRKDIMNREAFLGYQKSILEWRGDEDPASMATYRLDEMIQRAVDRVILLSRVDKLMELEKADARDSPLESALEKLYRRTDLTPENLLMMFRSPKDKKLGRLTDELVKAFPLQRRALRSAINIICRASNAALPSEKLLVFEKTVDAILKTIQSMDRTGISKKEHLDGIVQPLCLYVYVQASRIKKKPVLTVTDIEFCKHFIIIAAGSLEYHRYALFENVVSGMILQTNLGLKDAAAPA